MSQRSLDDGSVPVLSVDAGCLPEAWEKAVLSVWEHGIDVRTEYDRPSDPPSKDATVVVTIADPFAEPRIHRNFPGGPEELEAYRQEVAAATEEYLRGASSEELNTARPMMTWQNKERLLMPAHVFMRPLMHIYQHQGQILAMCRLMGKPATGMDFPIT